jgi:Transposase DDE domain group 1
LDRRKRRIQNRLANPILRSRQEPMFTARNIHYEMAERSRGLNCAGIGVIHQIVRAIGLAQALDQDIQLLKVHLPYHESDHILNIAYNILAGGTCLEDLELRRNDENYLDALGAARIPDPTTAGDFCRRFTTDAQIMTLMEAINKVRLKVWKQQDASFFEQAVLDVDGTLAPTSGECKEGMDISYDGQWGYHPLLVSLANTKEPLYLLNRSGNRPSHEGADAYLDKAIALCRQAGFKRVLARGDTDFMQTWKLDEWDKSGDVTFIFGADATRPMIARAEQLPQDAWRRLHRAARYEVKTKPRVKPDNIKEQIVREREFKNYVLQWEDVAEFQHRPHLCRQSYRMIVLRKKISTEQGQEKLFEEYRYFFYITNDRTSTAEQIVFSANDRCDQENLIEQLKNGVRALRNPLDNLHSNWAYMVMASLAWTLKSWCGLLLPAPPGRWHDRYETERKTLLKMEFKRFANNLINLPCQIVRTGRRIVYRLLSWNPWVSALLRLSGAMRLAMRC